MSKLYWTEEGRVIPLLCEELTFYRRARKVLSLPATAQPGALYVLARAYGGHTTPLHISANGMELAAVQPQPEPYYRWYTVSLPIDCLRTGKNVFEFWADGTAMNGWSLGLEDGHPATLSSVSDDGGRSWRSSSMGYLNTQLGEYVVRVRLAEGEDPEPPAMVWEDRENERVVHLRQIIPAAARESRSRLEQVRALTHWLSSSWEHTGSERGIVYTPWDAETILAWGRARSGHDGRRPIDMCVHYAVAFVSCCQALGIPARCAVMMGAVNGHDGHFVAETWFDEYQKWVMVDPNADAIFCRDGVPMSVSEIQAAGSDLKELVDWGPGAEFQRGFPHIAAFVEQVYLTGACFQHRSVWSRTDFLSHPELSPPGHGSVAYCETGLIWEKRDLERGLDWFPYFAPEGYFDAPPEVSGGNCDKS